MKVAFVRYAAAASVLAAAGLLAMVQTSQLNRAVGASLQQPGLPLRVGFDPTDLDAATRQLFQAMQNTIDGFTTTPAERTTYFSAVNNVNGWVVNEWVGTITNVQPNANGHLVSIFVIPGLSGDEAACGVVFDSNYTELYQVFPDGSFQFVGALDPQGLAGQMPTIIGL